jgi:hypothetical protein
MEEDAGNAKTPKCITESRFPRNQTMFYGWIGNVSQSIYAENLAGRVGSSSEFDINVDRALDETVCFPVAFATICQCSSVLDHLLLFPEEQEEQEKGSSHSHRTKPGTDRGGHSISSRALAVSG